MSKKTGKNAESILEIVSLSVKSDVVVCLNRTQVKSPYQPNWSSKLAPEQIKDGLGSRRPGVFIVCDTHASESDGCPRLSGRNNIFDMFEEPQMLKKAKKKSKQRKNQSILQVKVNINRPDDLHSAILLGYQEITGGKAFAFYGYFETKGKAKQIVNVVPLEEPVGFKRVWGDIRWYVLVYKQDKLETYNHLEGQDTRMEIFWIYGYPGKMYKRGVWAEVLRVLGRECHGLERKHDIVRRVVNYSHAGTGLRYDSYLFHHYYLEGWLGGMFKLEAYLDRKYPFLNCYDIAGCLQTLLGAVGIHVSYTIMQPFGYLLETSLLGRGRCNNPGFSGQHGPEILPDNNLRRYAFKNHAFCILDHGNYEIILDACAGPHFGDHHQVTYASGYKQTYLNRSIDALTALYDREHELEAPGRIKNMYMDLEGVTDVHSFTLSPFDEPLKSYLARDKKVEEFKKQVDFDNIKKIEYPDGGVVVEWEKLSIWEKLKESFQLEPHSDFRMGMNEAAKMWSFKGEFGTVNIDIFVGNNTEIAQNRLLLQLLSGSHSSVLMERRPSHRELGFLHVSGNYPYYSVEMWWYYNVLVNIMVYNPPVEIDALLSQLQEQIEMERYRVDKLAHHLPKIENLRITSNGRTYTGSKGKVGVGREITIEVDARAKSNKQRDPLRLEFFLVKGDGLRLVKESPMKLTFKGIKTGSNMVKLVVVTPDTLLCSKAREVHIEVI